MSDLASSGPTGCALAPSGADPACWPRASGSRAVPTPSSLAHLAITPGAVGVTQATNALALKTCCDVPNSVAVDYSTAQQLITTAWNQLLAIVMLLWVFGWSGGKQLVGASYTDAKTKVAETKEERRRKKEAKQAEKERREGEEA